MTVGEALQTVNRFYEAWTRKLDGLDEIAKLVDEEMTFTGPLMTTRGRQQYLDVIGQFLPAHGGFEFLRQFENGDEVCSIYETSVNAPDGSTLRLPVADWTRLADGRIVEQRIYYDPREFAAVFGMDGA